MLSTTTTATATAYSSSYSRLRLRLRCCEDTLGRPHHAHRRRHLPAAVPGPIPRPRRIILIRHGQSEGNVDESAYTRVPDPNIRLTRKGWTDAEDCGARIREMVEKGGGEDWKVYFYVSPYRRTLETLEGLGRAFERERIAGVREEPRLREQDFGKTCRKAEKRRNFQI